MESASRQMHRRAIAVTAAATFLVAFGQYASQSRAEPPVAHHGGAPRNMTPFDWGAPAAVLGGQSADAPSRPARIDRNICPAAPRPSSVALRMA